MLVGFHETYVTYLVISESRRALTLGDGLLVGFHETYVTYLDDSGVIVLLHTTVSRVPQASCEI